MQNITVTRYADPKAVGWAGYLEPADGSWIAFIGRDGRPTLFLHRDLETGAVLPDDPHEREAELARRGPGYRALHTGVRVESADVAKDASNAHLEGVLVPPIGEGPIG